VKLPLLRSVIAALVVHVMRMRAVLVAGPETAQL
jgi:hypothetical protein